MNDARGAKNPLRVFTQAGRVLVVVSMTFGAVVFYLSIEREFFPSGFYPLLVLLLPGFGGALALFCIGCIIYRIFRIKVWATPPADTGPSSDEMRRPNTTPPSPHLMSKRPNKAPEPTTTAVMPRAFALWSSHTRPAAARVAPAVVVAHL